jgi:hypothetical protein
MTDPSGSNRIPGQDVALFAVFFVLQSELERAELVVIVVKR